MHGNIHTELKKYVETRHGSDIWKAVLEAAGLPGRTYTATGTYPDREVVAIVKAVSLITKRPAETILEDFGEFIVPALLERYKSFIDTIEGIG